jgi:hypothetical protein
LRSSLAEETLEAKSDDFVDLILILLLKKSVPRTRRQSSGAYFQEMRIAGVNFQLSCRDVRLIEDHRIFGVQTYGDLFRLLGQLPSGGKPR